MIESAIVIPLMTFMILGVLQLTMVQHARIMTEYAAFNAARAGIVWNADPWIMENAAIISLMPTSDRLMDDLTDPERMVKRIIMRALMYQINRRLPEAVDLVNQGTDRLISQLPAGLQGNAESMRNAIVTQAANWADAAMQNAIRSALGGKDIRMVQVRIINPRMGDFNVIDRDVEIPFDSIREGAGWRKKTQLTIEVRYLYMMKIPFANWIIHSAWRAHRASITLYGAVYNPHTDPGDSSMFSKTGRRPNLVGPSNLDQILANLASGDPPVFLVPLRAQYTMRMQSDPYRVSLMTNDAVDD